MNFYNNTYPAAADFSRDFGDDNTSVDPNPTHTYLEPEEYTAFLEVQTKDGCTITISNVVEIIEELVDNLDFPNAFAPKRTENQRKQAAW